MVVVYRLRIFIAALVVLTMINKLGSCQNPNTESSSSLSVPIGALLPEGNPEADAIFKLALRRHNARVATLMSTRRDETNPLLRFSVFLQTTPINDSFLMAQEFCNHVKQRTHSIIGFWERSTASTMLSYANAFNIPWITPSLAAPTHQSPFVITLHPRLERLMLNFIQKLKWKKFTVIYDVDEVHLSVKRLLDFGLQSGISVQVRTFAGKSNILPTLKSMACNNEHHVVLDVSLDRALYFLEQVYAMGMLSIEYHYVFTDLSLIDQNLNKYAQAVSNLTFLSTVDREADGFRQFLGDVAAAPNQNHITHYGCDSALVYDAFTAMSLGMKSILNRGFAFQLEVEDELKMTNKVTCNQMPVAPLSTGYEISKSIKQVQFNGLTGNVQFNENGERINYGVDIYALDSNGMHKVGRWVDKPGEKLGHLTINSSIHHDVLSSFKNQTLIITTIIEEPYVMLKSNSKEFTGNDRYEGFCVDILREISNLAAFEYRIKPVDDGQYGSKIEADGTWNGMIGEVKYQKAHMAVAPLTITSAREAVVDFTKPFMSLGISIMIKKPEKQTPHIFSFLEPLSYEIWICIVFAYIGVSVVLYLVSRFSPYEWHKGSLTKNDDNDEEVDSATDFGILNSLWFSLGAFVQQGCDISPKSFSGRIVGGVWWFFTLIIISSYTANLAAFLTVDRMESPISGAEDLSKQNLIKYGTLKSGSTVNFFKQSPLPTFEKMWAYMNTQRPSIFVNSNKEGIARVRSSGGKYAFLMESSLNEYMEHRRPCNTLKVGPNIDSKGYGIALPKGSPYYDTINLAILTLREQGKLQKMKNYWWYDKSECGPSSNEGPTKTPALALSNVAGVFYILIGGMGLAILCALAEFAHKAASLRKKAKRKIRTRRSRSLLSEDGEKGTRGEGTERHSLSLPQEGDKRPRNNFSFWRTRF